MNLTQKSKEELFELAKEESIQFCKDHDISIPTIRLVDNIKLARNKFMATGLYRNSDIQVSRIKSAKIGSNFRQWSFPGYKVDRTPYGVVFHELGHHIYRLFGLNKNNNDLFLKWIGLVQRGRRITNYEPNVEESFAESFRLFCTNSDYLMRLNPYRYDFIVNHLDLLPFEKRNFIEVLCSRGADDRWISAAEKSIK